MNILYEMNTFNNLLQNICESKDVSLKYTYIYNPSCDIDCISIAFGVGSRNEIICKDKQGISHFLEHMVFNGSANYTKDEINEKTSFMGGHINAATSNLYTNYYCSCIKDYTEDAIKILLDIVFKPTLSKEHTEKERSIILKEYDQCYDDENKIVFYNMMKNSCDDALCMIPLGTKEGINSITHEDLAEYHKKFYTLNNSHMVISTSKPREEIDRILRNVILDLELESYVHFVPGKSINHEHKFNQKETVFSKSGKTQSILLAYNVVERQDVLYAECFSNILSNGLGARLTKKLREEKQLCYQCGSYVTTYGNKYLLCSMIKYSDGSKTKEIIDDIHSIYTSALDTITDYELQTAKNALLGSLASTKHSIYYPSHRAVEIVTEDVIYNEEDIKAITKEKIYEFINYSLVDKSDMYISRFEPK